MPEMEQMTHTVNDLEMLTDEEYEDDGFTDEIKEEDDPYELTDEEISELADEEDEPEFPEEVTPDEDDDEAPPTDGEAEPPAQGDQNAEQPKEGSAEVGVGEAAQNGAGSTPDYAKMAADDLALINKVFPGMALTDLRKIDNPGRYGALRDMGLSAEEAFRATNHSRIVAHVAATTRAKADGKSHIRGDMPAKGQAVDGFSMSAAEMRDARDLFPDKSDKEIISLYRSVSKR